MVEFGNIFDKVPPCLEAEEVAVLAQTSGARVERIVSTGQASPLGFWYDQERPEWVVLLTGSAGLLIEGEPTARRLRPGDHVLIPAGLRHRVEWTDETVPTVWLAVHMACV